MNSKTFFLFLIFLSLHGYVFPQNNGSDVIQFSGVVVSRDSLKPITFASILVMNSFRGTVSDYYGFFSLVAKKRDTIEFASIGYKKSWYIIPDTLTINRYSLIQMLSNDTLLLRESVIYPWPTQEQFHEAFLKLNIPDDDLERAKKNLAREAAKEKMDRTAMDGSGNYKYSQQQRQSQLYYVGQYQPNNLLNPIAWAKFIQAWQNGDFKKKNNTSTE